MSFRKYMTEISLTGITAVIVGLTVLFNDINIQIRIKELRLFLQRSSREDNSIDHIGLVMKYRLHKEMYENRTTAEDTGVIETRINSILSGREVNGEVLPVRYNYLSIPVFHAINFIRLITGMPLIEEIDDDDLNLSLEVAYYHERNKDYRKAIALYNQIFNDPSSSRTLKAGVLLHTGFCYSIIGDYEKAKSIYLTVIKEYSEINTAVTAAVMLRYLEGFRTEIEKVLSTEKDSTSKGVKLYKLIAYTESYEVLKRIENTASSSEREKIRFFKGRTLEEIGETGKAIDIYQQIVMDNPQSEYASSANRRIYLVGSVNHEGGEIKRLAVENNKLVKDETLVKMVEEDAKFIKNDKNHNSDSAKIKNLFSGKIAFDEPGTGINSESIDKMIRKTEERVNDNKNLSSYRNDPVEMKVKIYTKDGNIFTGILVKETPDQIVIRSSLGVIKISRSKISRRIDL
jgi:tetratricopeptide (TPR) repeat protein